MYALMQSNSDAKHYVRQHLQCHAMQSYRSSKSTVVNAAYKTDSA